MARKWTAAQKAAAAKRMKARWASGKMGKKRRKSAAKKPKAKRARRKKAAHKKAAAPKVSRRRRVAKVSTASAHPKVLGYVALTAKDVAALRTVSKAVKKVSKRKKSKKK